MPSSSSSGGLGWPSTETSYEHVSQHTQHNWQWSHYEVPPFAEVASRGLLPEMPSYRADEIFAPMVPPMPAPGAATSHGAGLGFGGRSPLAPDLSQLSATGSGRTDWERTAAQVTRIYETQVPQATADLHQPDAVDPSVSFPLLRDFARLHELRNQQLRRVATQSPPTVVQEAVGVGSMPSTGRPFSQNASLSTGHIQAVPSDVQQLIHDLVSHQVRNPKSLSLRLEPSSRDPPVLFPGCPESELADSHTTPLPL